MGPLIKVFYSQGHPSSNSESSTSRSSSRSSQGHLPSNSNSPSMSSIQPLSNSRSSTAQSHSPLCRSQAHRQARILKVTLKKIRNTDKNTKKKIHRRNSWAWRAHCSRSSSSTSTTQSLQRAPTSYYSFSSKSSPLGHPLPTSIYRHTQATIH